MSHRLGTTALFFTAMALAGFDWFVQPLSADDGPARRQADVAAPTVVSPTRDLTATFSSNVRIGDVECRVVATPRGYQLRAHNTGGRGQTIALRVDRTETSGSPMSRMGPIPRVVASETLTLAVAPGATETRWLAGSVAATTGAPGASPAGAAGTVEGVVPAGTPAPQPGSPDAAPPVLLGMRFRTVDVSITSLREGPAASAVVLRMSSREPAPGSDPSATM